MWRLPRNLLPVGMIVFGGVGGELAAWQTPAAAAPPPAAETNERPSSSERSSHLAVPSDVVQKETLKMLLAIYGDEIKTAKTRQQKQTLAEKMLQKSGQMSRDADGRFVLLELAQKTAAQAGDANTALQAAEQIASLYAVDSWKLRAKLTQLFKGANDAGQQDRDSASPSLDGRRSGCGALRGCSAGRC